MSHGLVYSWKDVLPEECLHYHFIDLPGGEVLEGQWDLRGRMPEYIGNVDVSGKRIIDIGCASGFLSFEMERLGAANVVSFDADDHRRIANIPVIGSDYVMNRKMWAKGVDEYLVRLKNSYWYSHQKLSSNAVAMYGDIYDIPTSDQSFDIAVLGQILVHLRDPITAIAEAARICRDTLIITEGVFDNPEPTGRLHATLDNGGPPYIWWALSLEAYRKLLEMFGFEIESVQTKPYKCVQHEYAFGEMMVTTIVARRVHNRHV